MKNILILSAIAITITLGVMLGEVSDSITTSGCITPDTMLWANISETYNALQCMKSKPEITGIYVNALTKFDILYPIGYMSLIILLNLTARNIDERLWWLVLLGPFAAMADMTENAYTIIYLTSDLNNVNAYWVAHNLKWIFIIIGVTTGVISTIINIFRRQN